MQQTTFFAFSYDAFVRPTTTMFPDASYEQLTLDPYGNVTARRNRAGQVLNYSWNALDWMLVKISPSLSVTTSWGLPYEEHLSPFNHDEFA